MILVTPQRIQKMVSAEEIEALVLGHPAVADAAVVACPDTELGERLCVCVVPRPGQGIDLASLVEFLRTEKQVAAFKLPERLLVLDSLPRNPVGKIVKNQLRETARAVTGATP